MTTAALYRGAIESFGDRVDVVSDGRWSNSVPCCPDRQVRDLVARVTEEAL